MIKKLIIIPFILLLFIIGLSVDRGSSMQFIAGQAPEVTGGGDPDTATQVTIRVSCSSGTCVFRAGLYAYSGHGLLSESSEGSTSSGTAENVTVTLSTPTELTSSTTYQITLFSGDSNLSYYADAQGYVSQRSSNVTYPNYPDPLTSAAAKEGETAIQLKNSSGTVLLGPSDISGYNNAQATNSGTSYYYNVGYTY